MIRTPPFFRSGWFRYMLIEVAERHHLHEQRVEVEFTLYGQMYGMPVDEDVGLALDLHAVLLVAASRASCSCTGSRRAGVARRSARRRAGDAHEDLAARARGSLSSVHFMRLELQPVGLGEVVLVLVRNSSGPSNMRLLSAVSMWKTLSVFSTSVAHALDRVSSSASFGGSMYEFGLDDRLRVVVRLEALVAAQADRRPTCGRRPSARS